MTEKLTPTITSVHFVGSVCLPDTTTVFTRLCSSIPSSHLRSIPDGEPGKRRNFVIFQRDVFAKCPFVLMTPDFKENHDVEPGPDAPPAELLPLEYDDFALASYAEFSKLREQGIVPPGVRFQVSLPTPLNVVGNLVTPAWRAIMEPIYESALLRAVRRIQDSIPAQDLAIQWDMAGEMAFLENAISFPPWFSPVTDSLVERACRFMDAVDAAVKMGLHLCYGDLGHKHFKQPKDMEKLVRFANALIPASKRDVHWLHMPVPKDRKDVEYFSPLQDLKLGGAELCLGLLHMDDEEGSRERIRVARRFIREFGIATECGLGRASGEELNSVLEIAGAIIKEPAGQA